MTDMKRKTVATAFFYAMLIGVMLLTFLLFSPYLITLAIAATFAVILHPVYRMILRRCRGREGIAAAITVVLTIIMILLPVSVLLFQVGVEAANVYAQVSSGQAVWMNDLINVVGDYAGTYLPAASLSNALTQGVGMVAVSVQALFAGTLRTVFSLFLGILAYYYMLRDGPTFIRSFISLSPLPDGDDIKILDRLQSAMNSVIKGSLIIAILQGIASGVGLTIFGMPHAALLGAVAGIGALIPSIGTLLALGPAVIYLLVTGHTLPAVGLTVWGTVFVGMIDNLLHPYLVGRGLKIHPFFVLFAVLGGLSLFGPGGFILGPLTISLLFALFDLYKTEYLPRRQGEVKA